MKNLYLMASVWLALTLVFIGSIANAQAPVWQMALATEGLLSDVTATASDASGNVYVVGSFFGTVRFGNTTLSSGSNSIQSFLAKWSTTSHSYVWAQRIDGSLHAIAVNGSSIYIAGNFSGTITIGSTILVNTNNTPTGPTNTATTDAFVAKITDLGPTGGIVWVKKAGGAGEDVPTALAVSGNSVYVAGYYGYQRSYGPLNTPTSFGSIVLANSGDYNVFLAKITDAGSTGDFTWAQHAGGTFEDKPTALAVSGTSVYLAGYFGSSLAQFGTISMVATGSNDMFLAKLVDAGSTGTFAWVQHAGGNSTLYYNYINANAVAVHGSDVFVVGSFSATANFGNIALTSSYNGSFVTSDVFVAKLVDAGSTANYAWVQQAGGVNSDDAQAVVVRGTNIYVGGAFQTPSATFGTTTLTSAGGTDLFVSKLIDAGTSGYFTWTQHAGGTGTDIVSGMVLIGTELYVGGSIFSQANFGSYSITSPGGNLGGYLTYLTDPTLTATASALTATGVTIFPNPTHDRATVQLPAGSGPATLTILDALGRTLRTQTTTTNATAELDLTGLAPGLYAVRVAVGGSVATRRLMIE